MKRKSSIISNKEIELLIPGYPKGSDITIMNTSYIGKTKNEDGKFENDYIAILFRDNTTGAKYTHIIYEPEYTFYVNQNGGYTNNLFFIEKDKVTPVTCKYSDILRAIAEATGKLQDFMNNISDGMNQENKRLHADPTVFMSDLAIENYYRFLFGLSYPNNVFKLSKGYMDIETDISYCDNQFPEPGSVPINAIAYCDEAHNTVYQFIYNDKRNPLVEKYKNSFQVEDILLELKEFVISAVGGTKKAIKFGIDKLEYKIVFFNDELEMICKMFEVVKATVPDFIEFWNMAFDLTFIIARLEALGADPLDVICDNRIEQNFLRYYIDERNRNAYEERGDFVSASSFTIWIDQMIEFASRRKGRGRYQSFKLDAIGEEVAGVRKLDYSHITNNIGDLPYIDMKTFSFYNIMDVIVQMCIEHSTQDLEYVFTKCLVNNTSYAKCHRQSVYLANRFAKDFYNYGYIMGNNKNRWNEKPSAKFPGAMVGDPLHNSEDVMVHINGRPTLLSDNTVDFDYSSLYPSIILENNLAPNTQIGKVVIEDPDNPNRVFSLNEHQDMYSSDDEIANYSRGGEFLENLISNNPLEFCKRWMRLGDVHQVIEDMKEYFQFNGYRGASMNPNDIVTFVKHGYSPNLVSLEEQYYSPLQNIVTSTNSLDKSTKDELINDINRKALL